MMYFSLFQWIPEIKDVAPETPFILVGCKNDLRTDSTLDYFLSVPGDQNNNEPLDSVGKNKVCSVPIF